MTTNSRGRNNRSRRGAALIAAVALSVCLTMVVSGAALQTLTELKVSSTNLHYERALSAAEAGANAYLSRLTFGPSVTYSLPPVLSFGAAVPTDAEFRAGLKSGAYTLTSYPSGSSGGYCAGTVGKVGATANVVSFGVSNGVVRRVTQKVAIAQAPTEIEDDTKLFPFGDYVLYGKSSMIFFNNAVVTGRVGSNGSIDMNNNCSFAAIDTWSVDLYGAAATIANGKNCVYTLNDLSASPDVTGPIWPNVSDLAKKVQPNGLLDLAKNSINDNASIVRDGVAGSASSVLTVKMKGSCRFPSKVGGSHYYLTSATFGVNSTAVFDNANGPIVVWFGPSGGTGYWTSDNGMTATVTHPELASINPVTLAFATQNAVIGKNKFSFDIGIYAIEAVNGQMVGGNVELDNNGGFTGSCIANNITVRNNAVFGSMHVKPRGAYYYKNGLWTE